MSKLSGMPQDLAAVLNEPGIVVRQDARVFELIAGWAKAPTPTVSATSAVTYEVDALQALARQTQVKRATTGASF